MRHQFIAGVLVLALAGLAAEARAQQYTLVSVASDGTAANGNSSSAAPSRDGRFVAFKSTASNLVASDTNNSEDVFVRDLVGHTTTIASVMSGGAQAVGDSTTLFPMAHLVGPGVSMSDDGGLVAFSTRQRLVAGASNDCPIPGRFGPQAHPCTNVYVRDRAGDQTTRVNVASDGTQANGESGDPQISGNGRYVVFGSEANNLVAGDQNNVGDVFLHDRVTHTTTRLSVSSTGAEVPAASYDGVISADGGVVAFISEGALVSDPDPLPCVPAAPCARAFILDRTTGHLVRVPVPSHVFVDSAPVVAALALTPDGRFLAMSLRATFTHLHVPPTEPITIVAVYDRQLGRLDTDSYSVGSRFVGISLNDTGRFVSIPGGSRDNTSLDQVSFDRLTNTYLSATDYPFLHLTTLSETIHFSADGLRIVFGDNASYVPEDTNTFFDVYLFNRDTDHDGMPDTFETAYGLNPNDPNDAAQDSDGDGVSNLQEYQSGTFPKGSFKRYFAEGAANSFFTTRLALFNPGDRPATVFLEFLGENHEIRSVIQTLIAHGRVDVTLDDTTVQQPDNAFSTVIESDQPIVADRTMSWDKSGYGSHAETSIAAPGHTWYLAEGSTGGAFDLFYLLENPGDTGAGVTISYLLPAPAAPIIKHYFVPAKSRRTIYVDTEDPGLVATDVSAQIASDQPILAERAMYYSTPTQAFAAGHEGAAGESPATSWFFAEGATGTFFDMFLLLANADTHDASVQVTYLLPSGAPIVKTYPVAAQSRLTINVDNEDPRLLDTPVSSIVESTNGVPIVAERAMWWPSPNWYEAHLSAGATATGTRWALADGQVVSTLGLTSETYVLIANTSNTPGMADVTVYLDNSSIFAPITKTYTLPANSRVSLQMSVEFPDLVAHGGPSGFSTIIQSSGPPIVVERAVYSNANGQIWAAGSDAPGTKLQ